MEKYKNILINLLTIMRLHSCLQQDNSSILVQFSA